MKSILLVLTGAVVISAGCVNARDEYDGFANRIPDAAPPIDAMIVSSIPDVSGEFLVVARPDLPEDRFFSFHGTFAFTSLTENTGEVDVTFVALDYTTFEEVGDPFVQTDVEVGQDGIALIPLIGQLDAAANSVSGSNAQLDAIIRAELRASDFVCGDLTGTGGALSLEGSTFGAVPITGSTLPAPIHRCEDQP